MNSLATTSTGSLSSRGNTLGIAHIKELGAVYSRSGADDIRIVGWWADADGLGRTSVQVVELMGELLELVSRLALILSAEDLVE